MSHAPRLDAALGGTQALRQLLHAKPLLRNLQGARDEGAGWEPIHTPPECTWRVANRLSQRCRELTYMLETDVAIANGNKHAMQAMPDDFAAHFCRNDDGSWTCTSAATLHGPNGRIQVATGSTFYPGTIFMGFDIAEWLQKQLDGRAQRCA
jgi:hypothetical protein